MYVQIKDKLQQQNLERKYEEYKLEEDELLTYKNIIYIPNVVELSHAPILQKQYYFIWFYLKTIC